MYIRLYIRNIYKDIIIIIIMINKTNVEQDNKDFMGRTKKELLIEFMKKRFPNESVESSYYQEWVERFRTGNPEQFMDNESLDIWNEINKMENK